MKKILERKNAKSVLAILKADPSTKVAIIAKKLDIWFNVANFLVKTLKSEGYVNSVTFESVMNKMSSNQADTIKTTFLKNNVVSNKDLLVNAKVSRLTDGMKSDINLLVTAGYIKKEKVGTQVLYKRI